MDDGKRWKRLEVCREEGGEGGGGTGRNDLQTFGPQNRCCKYAQSTVNYGKIASWEGLPGSKFIQEKMRFSCTRGKFWTFWRCVAYSLRLVRRVKNAGNTEKTVLRVMLDAFFQRVSKSKGR